MDLQTTTTTTTTTTLASGAYAQIASQAPARAAANHTQAMTPPAPALACCRPAFLHRHTQVADTDTVAR